MQTNAFQQTNKGVQLMISGTETNHEEGQQDTLGFNFMHHEEINSLPSTSVLIDTGSTVSIFNNKEILRNATKNGSALRVHTNGGF